MSGFIESEVAMSLIVISPHCKENSPARQFLAAARGDKRIAYSRILIPRSPGMMKETKS
jgi:hypothetical protein